MTPADAARDMLRKAMERQLQATANLPGRHISGYIHFPPLSGLPKPSRHARLLNGTILDTNTYANRNN